MDNLLEVNGISKKYRKFCLDKVSFVIPKGTICGFVGINGAGKSTTVKIIEELVGKDEGNISYFGKNELSSQEKENIGFVPDSCYFYEKQKISDVKRFISGLYNNWNEDSYQKYISFFCLDEKKKIGELSKGMKMQLSLTLALSHNAKLLIMDEPTSGLDPYIRNQVMTIIKEFTENREKAVLFSTHIMSDLEKIADRIIFIHQGQIMFEKEMSKLPDLFMNLGVPWTTLDESVVSYIDRLKKGN